MVLKILMTMAVDLKARGYPILNSSWWRHQMETFSALLAICAGNSPVTGEFPTQRPVTRSFDVYFDLRLNKRLSKQSWGWWFETLSCPLWRHRDVGIARYSKYCMFNCPSSFGPRQNLDDIAPYLNMHSWLLRCCIWNYLLNWRIPLRYTHLGIIQDMSALIE